MRIYFIYLLLSVKIMQRPYAPKVTDYNPFPVRHRHLCQVIFCRRSSPKPVFNCFLLEDNMKKKKKRLPLIILIIVLIIAFSMMRGNGSKSESGEEAAPSVTQTAESEPEEDAGDDAPVNGIRPSFKEAMDEYEAFFDSYVEFMEKYMDADPADSLSMMADYGKYMQDYTDAMEALEKIEDDEDLSNEELVYYTEVMGRINTKLAKTLQ